jgi:hypothetical protein
MDNLQVQLVQTATEKSCGWLGIMLKVTENALFFLQGFQYM